MDRLTREQRSNVMRAVRSAGSKIEREMWAVLESTGYSFEKSPKDILGKPDIVFRKEKVAVFCDSEFWHGYKWKERKKEIKSNRDFWLAKIESNIKRDWAINRRLRKEGWKVVRFWGNEILKNPDRCGSEVIGMVKGARTKQ